VIGHRFGRNSYKFPISNYRELLNLRCLSVLESVGGVIFKGKLCCASACPYHYWSMLLALGITALPLLFLLLAMCFNDDWGLEHFDQTL
jgi:hypothetical protein